MQVQTSRASSRLWLLVLATAVVAAWPGSAQNPMPVFRAGVSRVTLSVPVFP